MGQSTDAILFYGLCWDEERDIESLWGSDSDEDDDEERDEERDEESWENRYALLKHEIFHPKEEYSDAVAAIYSKYWEAVSEAVKESGVKISTHCSNECSMPYIAIENSICKANRGYPVAIGIDDLLIYSDWEKKLRDFCEVMGIKIEGMRVGWWLVSDWY